MTKKHNTRSEAQRATQERNYRIFLLRGMAANAALFTDGRHATFVALVDAQLTAMGARPLTNTVKQTGLIFTAPIDKP